LVRPTSSKKSQQQYDPFLEYRVLALATTVFPAAIGCGAIPKYIAKEIPRLNYSNSSANRHVKLVFVSVSPRIINWHSLIKDRMLRKHNR